MKQNQVGFEIMEFNPNGEDEIMEMTETPVTETNMP